MRLTKFMTSLAFKKIDTIIRFSMRSCATLQNYSLLLDAENDSGAFENSHFQRKLSNGTKFSTLQ